MGRCSCGRSAQRRAYQLVDVLDGSRGLRAVGPELVTGMIDGRIVKGDEVRALLGGQAQPGEYLVDALFVGKAIVEFEVVGGAAGVDLGF